MRCSTAPLQPQTELGESFRVRYPALFHYLKKSHPSTISDYRPVVLTSHIMKVLERLLLTHVSKQVNCFQDPLQFAYHPGVGVEDAIIYLLQPTPIWSKQAALQRSYSLISPMLLMQFSLYCSFEVTESTGGCLHNHLDYWWPDNQTRVCETEVLCVWEGGQQHKRLYSYCLSSLCTPQTSSTTHSSFISRNTLMTLQLLGVSVPWTRCWIQGTFTSS